MRNVLVMRGCIYESHFMTEQETCLFSLECQLITIAPPVMAISVILKMPDLYGMAHHLPKSEISHVSNVLLDGDRSTDPLHNESTSCGSGRLIVCIPEVT
jgi:hypothetical protein